MFGSKATAEELYNNNNSSSSNSLIYHYVNSSALPQHIYIGKFGRISSKTDTLSVYCTVEAHGLECVPIRQRVMRDIGLSLLEKDKLLMVDRLPSYYALSQLWLHGRSTRSPAYFVCIICPTFTL